MKQTNTLNRFRKLFKKSTSIKKNTNFALENNCDMEHTSGLNAAQMDFLRLLGHFTTVEQVDELRKVVCDYYAKKIDEEVDKLWDEGKWDNEKNEAILKEHLRTPYKK